MYQLSTVLGSLVSLLAGTIEFLYKEALHTIMHCVRNALEGPGQPPPYIGQNRSRDYAAPRNDLGSRRATHLRAQLEP